MNIEDLDAVKRLIDPIASEIANLSNRIAQNRSAVAASETATRNQLIEPLMRALGWDASDPKLVTPEFSVGRGRADYALMDNGKPTILIEAKKFGTKLTAETLLQAFGYAVDDSVKYVVISNGDSWEVHRIPLTGRKPFATFAITGTSPYCAALDAAKLARVVVIENPRVVLRNLTEERQSSPGGTSENEFRSQGHESETVRDGWLTFDELEFKGKSPKFMKYPEGKQVSIGSWKAVWLNIAEWITDMHAVDGEMIFGENRNLMAIRTTNQGFWEGFEEQLSNGLWVTGGTINPSNVRRCSRALLEYCGVDPNSVQFKFGDVS